MPDSQDTWIGDRRSRSTVRNSYLYLTGASWKSLAHSEYEAQGMISAGFTGPRFLSLYHCPTTLAFRSLQNLHLFIVGRRASMGSGCCSASSLSSLGTCFSSIYQDLAKHIVNTSMADVSLSSIHSPSSCCYSWTFVGWGGRQKEPGRLGPPRH